MCEKRFLNFTHVWRGSKFPMKSVVIMFPPRRSWTVTVYSRMNRGLTSESFRLLLHEFLRTYFPMRSSLSFYLRQLKQNSYKRWRVFSQSNNSRVKYWKSSELQVKNCLRLKHKRREGKNDFHQHITKIIGNDFKSTHENMLQKNSSSYQKAGLVGICRWSWLIYWDSCLGVRFPWKSAEYRER